ncbi:MAG: hypothetical protein IKP88_02195 [Lachnospiraceae bacterium]|nr:hypothetical protein [Lachnospiraceae bacterium]
MKTLRRKLCVLLTFVMVMTASFGTCTFAYAKEANNSKASYKVESKIVPIYMFAATAESTQDINLYYINGSDVPYMKLEDWTELYKAIAVGVFGKADFDIKIQKDSDEDVVYLVRENNFFMGIDFMQDLFYFWDYNAFIDIPGNGLMDVTSGIFRGADGSSRYVKELSSTNQRYGDQIMMDLGAYGIDLVQKKDNYYIPVQTLSDIFLASSSVNLLYNGKALIATGGVSALLGGAGLTELGNIYYADGGSGKISKTMAEYSYKELCFALDTFYGLKDQHRIKDFPTLMKQVGYEQYFLSKNQTRTEKRLLDLINNSLDDQHSVYQLPSYAADLMNVVEYAQKKGGSRASTALHERLAELMTARVQFNPEGVPGYQEVGDTAFITFDNFTVDLTKDYYTTAPTAEDTDTIGIIAYSVQQILRKNSPIKNVVLDLSCNTGGTVATAIYTLGAFLGKASISLEDPNTGALVTHDYKVDTNFDGKFNSKDTLAGKGLNLYCIASSVSFSCGNLVPCAFKNSGKVTLLGQTSGGGTCTVMHLTTASGSIFDISSSIRMSFLKNGSFYDIDRGADPDIPITKTEHYYDRKALVEFIHGLF